MDNTPGLKKTKPYPLLLTPSYKNYIWGGDRLAREYGKDTDVRPIAESWELSCHPDGPSIIKNGAYKGRPLADVLYEHPGWVGANFSDASDFPILIKLIDAKQDLSLQVHPNDEYAREHECSAGKNEAWYVIDCEPGAQLILGMREQIPAGGSEQVPVGSGDAQVPAGGSGGSTQVPAGGSGGSSGSAQVPAGSSGGSAQIPAGGDAQIPAGGGGEQVPAGSGEQVPAGGSGGSGGSAQVPAGGSGGSAQVPADGGGRLAPLSKGGLAPATSPPLPKGGWRQQDLRRQGGFTVGSIAQMIADGSIADFTNKVTIKPGDCYCVPAGMLHAICGGSLITEVQQSSNITYRVYDYDRQGADGKPRQLHIKQAADVIDTAAHTRNSSVSAVREHFDGFSVTNLVDWRYFKLSRYDIIEKAELFCGAAFHALLIIEGDCRIEYTPASATSTAEYSPAYIHAAKGACIFIPAGLGNYAICGRGCVLMATE